LVIYVKILKFITSLKLKIIN